MNRKNSKIQGDPGLQLTREWVEKAKWFAFLPQAHLLEDYAVDFRYAGDTATVAEARLALKNCKSIRREVRSSLGLPV
ncbi:MAG: hypothetical protein ABSG59_05575 [Verrucomicrobiota bacterium]|jgi:hypothetical protein